jgi:uncharacterized protein (DUF302 family)
MTSRDFRWQAHTMARLDIPTGMPFDDFRAAFESAAPPPDMTAVLQIVADRGNWDDVRAQAASNAPNGLMIYATIDAGPVLALAGQRTQAVEYLLGNHVVAETMFRHDSRTPLYAPLRVLVHSDSDGNAVFSMDQPSTVFGGLGVPEITAVGRELDHKVATLLAAIGVDAWAAFGIER